MNNRLSPNSGNPFAISSRAARKISTSSLRNGVASTARRTKRFASSLPQLLEVRRVKRLKREIEIRLRDEQADWLDAALLCVSAVGLLLAVLVLL